jgi:hypothetical protein
MGTRRLREHSRRDILNGIFYILRPDEITEETGRSYRKMPRRSMRESSEVHERRNHEMHEEIGYVAEDLFVISRSDRPGVSRMVRQVHAWKNHSYFLVFWETRLRVTGAPK